MRHVEDPGEDPGKKEVPEGDDQKIMGEITSGELVEWGKDMHLRILPTGDFEKKRPDSVFAAKWKELTKRVDKIRSRLSGPCEAHGWDTAQTSSGKHQKNPKLFRVFLQCLSIQFFDASTSCLIHYRNCVNLL
jgi:hypothetical protein